MDGREKIAFESSTSLVYLRYTMTGKELRRARKRLGMTQIELAEAIGMQKNSVAMIERGLRPVMKTTELAVKYLLVMSKREKEKR
jgi:transcriptional regulator with XRE-family HTH domain